jgi:hypothetical protein
MSALVQDLTVSLIALGAAGLIVRRAVAMFAARPGRPTCGSCASGCATTNPPGARTEDGRRIIRPLVVDANRPQG